MAREPPVEAASSTDQKWAATKVSGVDVVKALLNVT